MRCTALLLVLGPPILNLPKACCRWLYGLRSSCQQATYTEGELAAARATVLHQAQHQICLMTHLGCSTNPRETKKGLFAHPPSPTIFNTTGLELLRDLLSGERGLGAAAAAACGSGSNLLLPITHQTPLSTSCNTAHPHPTSQTLPPTIISYKLAPSVTDYPPANPPTVEPFTILNAFCARLLTCSAFPDLTPD